MSAMMVWNTVFEAHAAVFDLVLAHPEGELRPMGREELATLDAAANAADALDDALCAWVAAGADGFEPLAQYAQAWVTTERDWRVTDEGRERAFRALVKAARDLAGKVASVN